VRISPDDRARRVGARLEALKAEFGNYEDGVRVISSFQQWIQHMWGPDGAVAPTLEDFDRFPQCNGLRPDFLARFRTGYRLCGEMMRTFRSGIASSKDVGQIVAYTRYLRVTSESDACADVLLLVHTHTDDAAAAAVLSARTDKAPENRPDGPVVIVGYMHDRRANGEWYDLKWRDQRGNSRFSEPNVAPADGEADLNSLIVDAPHCAIRVDLLALDISSSNPLINDEPPPLYTAITLVFPALNELLTEDERDELGAVGRLEKTVSRDAIMSTPCVSAIDPPAGYVQRALDFMVEIRWAQPIRGSEPPEYTVILNVKRLKKDLKDMLGERAARTDVAKLLRQRRRAQRRATRQQLKLL